MRASTWFQLALIVTSDFLFLVVTVLHIGGHNRSSSLRVCETGAVVAEVFKDFDLSNLLLTHPRTRPLFVVGSSKQIDCTGITGSRFGSPCICAITFSPLYVGVYNYSWGAKLIW